MDEDLEKKIHHSKRLYKSINLRFGADAPRMSSPRKHKPIQSVPRKTTKDTSTSDAKNKEPGTPTDDSYLPTPSSTPNASTKTYLGGKFQLGESLGKGAFGKVYRGLNVQTGDFCAVKAIEKDMLSDKMLPSIMREAEMLRTLEHPNIVRIFAFYETPKHLYFVMELMEGGSLYHTMKKFGIFPEPLLKRYLVQLLKGLSFLHSRKVIHRDIKGANLLLSKSGRVKLADFGSCTVEALDRRLTVVGTPFWMAPEVITMSGMSTAADIWSLGCTLIELITGKPPYWDLGGIVALYKMAEDDHPPLPTQISTGARDFLLQCFIREYEQRPTADDLLQHAWLADVVETSHVDVSLDELKGTIREHVAAQRGTLGSIEWE